MSIRSFRACAIALAAMLPMSAAHAEETVTYTYDALGRLVKVAKSSGPASGVEMTYAYDQVGNRTNVTVTGTSRPAPGPRYVVVPLNGYTLIVSP